MFYLFSGSRSQQIGSHYFFAQRGVPCVSGYIDSDRIFFQQGPNSIDRVAASILSNHNGGNTLAVGGQCRRIFVVVAEVMAMGVNKAWGQYPVLTVDEGIGGLG